MVVYFLPDLLEPFWPIFWIPSHPIPSHPIPSHPSCGRAEPVWTSSLHLTQQQWSSQPFQLSVFSLILLKIPSEIEMALRYPLLPLSTGLSCYTVQAAVHCLKSRMLVQLMTSCFSCYHVLLFWCLFISWSSVHVIMWSHVLILPCSNQNVEWMN